jgi:hypothetical protein
MKAAGYRGEEPTLRVHVEALGWVPLRRREPCQQAASSVLVFTPSLRSMIRGAEWMVGTDTNSWSPARRPRRLLG